MDIGRRSYKTACRFLRNSDLAGTIRWYEVPEDTPTLPYVSGIFSLDMERDKFAAQGLGEVYGAPRPFINQKAPAGMEPTLACGTEDDFQEGGRYLPNLPPAPYDAQGYLACCGMPAPPPPDVPYNFGSTCSVSSPPIGPRYAGTILAGITIEWWGANAVTPGQRYRVHYEVPAGQTGWTVGMYQGSVCGSSVYQVFSGQPVGTYDSPPMIGNKLWVTFVRPTPPIEGAPCKFRIELLPP